jgi:hypothetical protein
VNYAASLFQIVSEDQAGDYLPILTVVENEKGVLDVDTVKGCTSGMRAYPGTGCYGECYAQKTAARYGRDFSVSVSRKITSQAHWRDIFCAVRDHYNSWYRIGVAGDPCHDWDNTLEVCERLKETKKLPVIITKHWILLSNDHISRLKNLSAVVNTSTSGLDTDAEIKHRVRQIERLRSSGVRSVNRVITCDYGDSEWALAAKAKQDYLLTIKPIVDNPLRASKTNPRVISGEIKVAHNEASIGGGKLVSLHDSSVYLGYCRECPDQCGVEKKPMQLAIAKDATVDEFQQALFEVGKPEWIYVKTVIGSGFEADVSRFALEDGIAKRAARKNMQIHSAIILKIDGEFSGFMTFQNNDICKEFCLLQSVIEPKHFMKELYSQLVLKVIEQNVNKYPAIITTDPKSKFETPALFESLGFVTYQQVSGFCYMVHGNLADVRMKLLARITMTNAWNSMKGDWLRLKTEWRERIKAAGARVDVPNPDFATREGCWQGESGFANVVTRSKKLPEGRDHNGNASVLDAVACEVIVRFFTPTVGGKIYNPFGGGVQFGYVAGANGYDYTASEIRQNQCDANNKICSEFPNVRWIKSDSSNYDPDGMFDLVFTCPPYYRVEKYVDYDGNPPEGEINSFDTYEKFRDTLFAGYKKAIEHLSDNRFFVVMTGDSRDNKGAYYCSEAETELFFKQSGLSVYNKIVYLECEFTRLAQAKKTLNMRKFPKREQKIIVAFKGDIKTIKDLYPPLGRL